MKLLTILKSTAIILLWYSPCFAQNSPFYIWGTGLDGTVLQKLAIYADVENGLLLDAPKNASGSKLNISFNWRGGGTPPFFIRGSDAYVGIGTSSPWEKLHVNGSLGIGTWAGDPHSGLQIEYADNAGSGISVFKHSRWSSSFYFKRNGPAGERMQLYFGGAADHVMEIYNDNNEAKIRFHTNDHSYFNGGNVGIGTKIPSEKLTVNGTIYGKEIKVDLSVPGPDYVFEKDYALPPLSEIKSFIQTNKHLPEIPTANEMAADGIQLGEMNMLLLKKIEELTLYVIKLQEENQRQDSVIQHLQNSK